MSIPIWPRSQRKSPMATVRLVIVLFLAGVVVLLAVQNTSVALPLVFLGGQTVALPLSVWLLLAIALGALTTLLFTALLGANGQRKTRSKAYKYRPQPFYEPADTEAAAQDAAQDGAFRQRSNPAANRAGQPQSRSSRPNQAADSSTYGREWQDWTNLQSSNQLNDWDAVERESTARQASSSGRSAARTAAGAGIGSWLFGNRKAAEEETVNQSWQELSNDWDGLEDREYRAQGVSPVEDNLDEINQGWDDAHGGYPTQDFEVPQSPKRVYRDGTIYSYSYRSAEGASQRDNIYAPPDDVVYGDEDFDRDAYIDLSQPEDYPENPDQDRPASDYDAGGHPGEDLDEPEMAEDGVVDADYRVIIPPSPSSDTAARDETVAREGSWDHQDDDDDDWTDAEDALTP